MDIKFGHILNFLAKNYIFLTSLETNKQPRKQKANGKNLIIFIIRLPSGYPCYSNSVSYSKKNEF